MSALRTVASAVCIVIGAALLATWAAATAALSAIEDGTVIEDATARALATDTAKQSMIDGGSERALAALEQVGVNVDFPGVEAAVTALIEAAVNSETFAELVHSQTRSIREQVVADLNGPGIGAVTVTLDFSDAVNDGLGRVPLVGDSLPTVTVPGVPVQVMDERTGDTARTLWDWLHIAKQWFGWLGLAFLALGIVVSHRKRWYFMKVALAVAVISGAAWAVVTLVEPQTIAGWLPGGDAAQAIATELIASAEGAVATTMACVALGAAVVALVLCLIAPPRQRKVGQ